MAKADRFMRRNEHARRVALGEEIAEMTATYHALAHFSLETWRANAFLLLREVVRLSRTPGIEAPHVDNMRAWAERNIAYLNEGPGRTIGADNERRANSYLRTMRAAIHRHESGTEVWPPADAMIREGRRRRDLRRAHVRDTKPQLPAWMSDPSLLPKRPPGAV